MASPRCQYILNEIIYPDPCWQDRNLAVTFLWFMIQLLLVAILSLFYVPYKLAKLCRCNRSRFCCNWCDCRFVRNLFEHPSCFCCNWCVCRFVRNLFEHPYSKFMNHTTWYLAFLCVMFASTFQKNLEQLQQGSPYSVSAQQLYTFLCHSVGYRNT